MTEPAMTEWEFTALAASWINAAIQGYPGSLFHEARCEQRGSGSIKRRDITLLDANRQPVVTGEVKMPYQLEGASPYREAVVRDARSKAQKAGARYFFTWNVNRCVLWPTVPKENSVIDREYRVWEVADVHKPQHMHLAATEDRIRRWIPLFLRAIAQIIAGETLIGWKSPDSRFIDGLEAALEQPILLTIDTLKTLHEKRTIRTDLERWMRDEQGWVIYDDSDPQGVLENLSQASQFANYALVNKLVFHEALLKRYQGKLPRIDVPKHVDSGEKLRVCLESHFEKARTITNDYETVFGETQQSIGSRIPFYADPAVVYWRTLIEEIHEFDFSKLDYEIIGAIFERLISPEERHKYGQYYTRAEVVDLINSFCIRSGKEKVMDPACGGGTFLVRAYARKRELNPAADHGQRLTDLYGVDVSHFATHLTTINLATRDLVDAQNYPQVARTDFFNVEPGNVLLAVPAKITAAGLGSAQKRVVVIPPLDAVVGNPPYVRQEDIPKAPRWTDTPARGTKDFYKMVAEQSNGVALSGRSDLHVYFWLHAAKFLHHGGWLGFLTSSQWLDVDYGFRLQEYILRHFEIHAVFESIDEPWFVGARVVTCATLLRRQRDEAARMGHVVRFVQLRRPIAEVLEYDGTSAGAMQAADRFRDTIYKLTQDTVTPEYRVRLVRQGDLWNDGVRLGKLLGKSKSNPSKDAHRQEGRYYGGKWGVFLRAPDLWFKLMSAYGDRFVPLAQIADIRFGVKSGKDEFFFPVDASAELLAEITDPAEFATNFGVPRREVQSGKIKLVRCGAGHGEVRPLEAKLLEPLLHNLKDLEGFTVKPEDCAKMILLTGRPTRQLPPYGRAYVKWGEQNGWDGASSCLSRTTEARPWHDLTGHVRGALFWSMRHGYRHIAPINDANLQCNKAFFDLTPRGEVETLLLGGILNSTITLLSKYVFGRPVGVEGYWATEVIDAEAMSVPDPRNKSAAARQRVVTAFEAMMKRPAMSFISERQMKRTRLEREGRYRELDRLSDVTELNMDDRWALDDAVLRLIGMDHKADRQSFLGGLYMHLRQYFAWVRSKEEKANENKKRARKKGPAAPGTLAAALVEQMKEERPQLLKRWPDHFFDDHHELFDVFELPEEGEPQLLDDLIHQNTVRFTKGRRRLSDAVAEGPEQARLLLAVARAGIRGLVRVPHEAPRCERVYQAFREWYDEREAVIREMVERQTGDQELQERIRKAATPLLAVG